MPGNATYTYADLAAEFPVDNVRREIIDGELIVSPAPRIRHYRVSTRLYHALFDHLSAVGGGEIFHAPVDVVLSQSVVVQPDLIFLPGDQTQLLTDLNIQGAPALVIEVLSDARMDRVRKRDLYERFAIPEYWIVDPVADRVEIYRLRDDRYDAPLILEVGDTLTYDRLPGLRIDLSTVLAR